MQFHLNSPAINLNIYFEILNRLHSSPGNIADVPINYILLL